MVPTYGYMTDAVSPPEKMAECEKQVHEMNQKLTELQFDTMKARMTMEQMAEQQKQLLLDNERLRRRAEIADQRYLEELDSLSEIVGEVVSQAGTASKSNSAAKPSRGKNPMRPVPQSAAGQSL
jgi:regulator of replication initiation timing